MQRADTGVYGSKSKGGNKGTNSLRPKSAHPGTIGHKSRFREEVRAASNRPLTAGAKTVGQVRPRTASSMRTGSPLGGTEKRKPRPTSCSARKRPESRQDVTNTPYLWQAGVPEASPELASKVFHAGDPVKEDRVYVRPYMGRITDLDMRKQDHINYMDYPRIQDMRRKEQWERDINELEEEGMGTELQTPCSCLGCMLKEMRCLDVTGGKMYLRSRSQKMCVDKGALRGKLARYNKERIALMRDWAATAIQAIWRGFSLRKSFRTRMKNHKSIKVMQRIAR